MGHAVAESSQIFFEYRTDSQFDHPLADIARLVFINVQAEIAFAGVTPLDLPRPVTALHIGRKARSLPFDGLNGTAGIDNAGNLVSGIHGVRDSAGRPAVTDASQ